MIRQPIITVLGHVDHGKTSLLDSIRDSTVVSKEAGAITQHIGSTEVPIDIIQKISGNLLKKFGFELKIPGLLFIDTPGHEAFTTLRKRGGSIADLAVVVVDIHKGLQNQTVEAIEILKTYKCPFIVVANKVDTLQGWVVEKGSISENLKTQREDVLEQLDIKIYKLVGQLHEKGFASERFDRITDFTKEVTIIPASAKKEIGIPEILMFLSAISKKYLDKKLIVNEEGNCKGTVLEVKDERGLGKTIDVILYDGMLKVGEEIILGGKNGVIKTKIRALLEPKPIGEGNPNEKFNNIKEIHAAAGVKISAPNLDDAISGSPLRHCSEENEKEINDEIHNIKIESDAIGPIVRSNTLGSLEAIIKLLEDKGIKVKKADIGEIPRKDVLEMESVAEKDKYKGVIFAFHTKVSEAAKIEAKKRNVKIFESNVVYKILEDYEEWVKEEKDLEKNKKLSTLTMPSKFLVMVGMVFRHSKPAIVGVRILEGKLKKGTKIMKNGEVIGKVQAIQSEGKAVDEATKGMEVAVSIDDAVVEKDLFEKDKLYSFIPQRDFLQLDTISDSFTTDELELIKEIKKMRNEA